jgi:hypothetical protein
MLSKTNSESSRCTRILYRPGHNSTICTPSSSEGPGSESWGNILCTARQLKNTLPRMRDDMFCSLAIQQESESHTDDRNTCPPNAVTHTHVTPIPTSLRGPEDLASNVTLYVAAVGTTRTLLGSPSDNDTHISKNIYSDLSTLPVGQLP